MYMLNCWPSTGLLCKHTFLLFTMLVMKMKKHITAFLKLKRGTEKNQVQISQTGLFERRWHIWLSSCWTVLPSELLWKGWKVAEFKSTFVPYPLNMLKTVGLSEICHVSEMSLIWQRKTFERKLPHRILRKAQRQIIFYEFQKHSIYIQNFWSKNWPNRYCSWY